MRTSIHLALVLVFSTSSAVVAADFSDPTWPCVQRKVENLSLGLMWPLALDESAPGTEQARKSADAMADLLTLRRVAVEDLRAEAERFGSEINGDPGLLGYAFARAFETLNKRRSRVMKGIGDFSLSQIALAEQIDETRLEMDAALDAAEPDYDKVDALEERLDWDQVIHSDRQRSITYLCETPQLIEKRLFAIARLLQEQVRDE